jgi:hypothetical protein
VKVAGVLWLVCGCLVVLSILGLLGVTMLWLDSPEQGTLSVKLGSLMAGCASIPLGLFSAALFIVGARTARGTAHGVSVSGVGSVLIGAALLALGMLVLPELTFEIWNLPPSLLNAFPGAQFPAEKLANTVPLLLLGALLLAAGCLALAGRGEYRLWRQTPHSRV